MCSLCTSIPSMSSSFCVSFPSLLVSSVSPIFLCMTTCGSHRRVAIKLSPLSDATHQWSNESMDTGGSYRTVSKARTNKSKSSKMNQKIDIKMHDDNHHRITNKNFPLKIKNVQFIESSGK